jgi:hypothetical protein
MGFVVVSRRFVALPTLFSKEATNESALVSRCEG